MPAPLHGVYPPGVKYVKLRYGRPRGQREIAAGRRPIDTPRQAVEETAAESIRGNVETVQNIDDNMQFNEHMMANLDDMKEAKCEVIPEAYIQYCPRGYCG